MIEQVSNRRLLAVALGLLWLVTLALPTVDAGYGYHNQPGYIVLVGGWMGPLILQFGWFANPLFLIAVARLIWIARPSRWAGYSVGGLLLMLTIDALFWNDVPDDAGSHPIIAYLPGYWLWLAVMAATGVWTILRPRLLERKTSV